MSISNKKNIIIIGPGRSGTTSLFDALASQRHIACSNVKETFYFSKGIIKYSNSKTSKVENYSSFFDKNGDITLEATPAYFVGGGEVARRINNELENFVVICVLRDPVERFLSLFQHVKNKVFFEPSLTLKSYVTQSKKTSKENLTVDTEALHYSGFLESNYSNLIQEWLSVIERKRFFILDYDRLSEIEYIKAAMMNIFESLGVFEDFSIQMKKTNQSKIYRSMFLQKFAQNINMHCEPLFKKFYFLKLFLKKIYQVVNVSKKEDKNYLIDSSHIYKEMEFDYVGLESCLKEYDYELPKWLNKNLH